MTNWDDIILSIYNIGKNNGYAGITENTEPDADYVNKNYDLWIKLLALAGYRLADTLNKILPTGN